MENMLLHIGNRKYRSTVENINGQEIDLLPKTFVKPFPNTTILQQTTLISTGQKYGKSLQLKV